MLYNNTISNQLCKEYFDTGDSEFIESYIQNIEPKYFGAYVKRLSNLTQQSNELQSIFKLTSYLDNLSDNIKNKNIINISYRILCIRVKLKSAPICSYCKENLLPTNQLRKLLQNKDRITPITCSAKCYRNIKKLPEYANIISFNYSIAGKKRWNNTSDKRKKEIYDKISKNNIKKYGTKCTLNTEENIIKKKNTWLQNYGYDNPNKSNIIRKKINQTNLEKYGNISPLCGNNQYKRINTWKQKYGENINWISEVPIVQKHILNTKQTKYGTFQNFIEKSWEKQILSYDKIDPKIKYYKKYHIFKFPKSNREIIVQGYEEQALLAYILKKYEEDDIINDIKFMNNFNFKYTYKNDNVLHRYIPDFYIKSEQLFIEVKSSYTLMKNLWRNFNKIKSVHNKNYKIIILLISIPNKNKINYKILTYEDIKTKTEEYYNIETGEQKICI